MTKRFLLFIAAGESDGKTPLVKRGLLAMAALRERSNCSELQPGWTISSLGHFSLGKTMSSGCARGTGEWILFLLALPGHVCVAQLELDKAEHPRKVASPVGYRHVATLEERS